MDGCAKGTTAFARAPSGIGRGGDHDAEGGQSPQCPGVAAGLTVGARKVSETDLRGTRSGPAGAGGHAPARVDLF